MAFSTRSLTPVTLGVAFPLKLIEVGRELGVSEDKQMCLKPGRESQCLFCSWALRELGVDRRVESPMGRRGPSAGLPPHSTRNFIFSDALYKS